MTQRAAPAALDPPVWQIRPLAPAPAQWAALVWPNSTWTRSRARNELGDTLGQDAQTLALNAAAMGMLRTAAANVVSQGAHHSRLLAALERQVDNADVSQRGAGRHRRCGSSNICSYAATAAARARPAGAHSSEQ